MAAHRTFNPTSESSSLSGPTKSEHIDMLNGTAAGRAPVDAGFESQLSVFTHGQALLVKWYRDGFVIRNRVFDSPTGHQKIRSVAQLVERDVWDVEAGSSRLSTPTMFCPRTSVD